jgi:hypothetical protein
MRAMLSVFLVCFYMSPLFSQVVGSEENLDQLRAEMAEIQTKIEKAFANFEKNPDSLFEKGSAIFTELPPSIHAIISKLENQKAIFLKRVESRKADATLSEERRKKSLQLYQGKLEEISEFSAQSNAVSKRISLFINQDIQQLKNEYNLDSEDFGKNEAIQNLKRNLDKIRAEFQKTFLFSKPLAVSGTPTTSSAETAVDQKKNQLDFFSNNKKNSIIAFDAKSLPVSTPVESLVKIFDGTEMVFCWVPPGEFIMGSPVGEVGRGDNEDQTRVKITHGFWLGKTEVTQAQWMAVMKSNTSAILEGDHPVESVSWHDCQEFITKLLPPGTGWKFALPTEAQWEYACRAGTSTPQPGNLDDKAWHLQNSNAKLRAVGKKKANDWGLHDMLGNVFEWCRDGYQKQLPSGTNPYYKSSGVERVRRGGCWYYDKIACRSAFRAGYPPDSKTASLGFRLALVPVGI